MRKPTSSTDTKAHSAAFVAFARLAALSAMLAFMVGCATTGANRADSTSRASAVQTFAAESVASTAVGQNLPPPEPEPETPAVASDASPHEFQPGTGVFLNEGLSRQPAPGPGVTGDVTFNFEGESLHAVIKAILGDFLQQNYVIAPGVSGNVTFSTAKPLRPDQALSILEMLLRWNNTTMVWQDGRYTILPVAQALPGNLTPRTGPLQNMRGYEVRAVPLQYISTIEMEKLLKPYAKPEAVINVDPARNMLVLAGSRAELENYLHTISIFDVDWLEGMSVGVFNLTQAEAAKTVGELEKIFGDGSNTPMAGMFRFMPLEGINAILVITPQPKYLSRIAEWIERFDLGGGEAGQRLFTYAVKNVKAADLATTLADVLGTSAPTINSSNQAGSVAPGLEPVEVRSVGTDGSTTMPDMMRNPNQANRRRNGENRSNAKIAGGDGGPVVDSSGGISLGASEEVRVSAVEESNMLLVLATSSQWTSIQRVIERLDTIPLQVHIEAKILQVSLNDQLRYGVQWFFENAIGGEGGLGDSYREMAQNRSGWGDLAGSVVGGNLSWTFLGPNIASIVTALDSVSRVNVLSMPSIVVLNNKAASINVGTQIPVNSSFINTGVGGGTGTSQTYVQFRDTGITLTVTPRVNPGGLVFMEIDQQDSTPGDAGDAIGGNVPVDQRKIKTEVAIQSGQTILLGGLIKQTDTKGNSGVPGLSRIPVIGGLFGSRSNQTNRQELLVMLTPTVIRNSDEARRLTEDYSRQFRALEPLRMQKTQAADAQITPYPEQDRSEHP